MRLARIIGLLGVTSLGTAQVHRTRAMVPSDDQIREILAERIDREHESVGIVVGVIDRDGARVVAYGRPDTYDGRTVNGDTVFEIGSLTKIFTSLLLTEKAERGEISLADPISKYLPVNSSITLEQLATNTSGLPRNPGNLAREDRGNPFAGYTRQMLLRAVPARAEPHWEYSNFGYGLLGEALTPDYDRAIHQYITEPLNMGDTRVALARDNKVRLAAGHDEHLAPVPQSDFGALAAAAGLRSTANDLLKLLSAFLGYTSSPLAPAMAAMLEARTPTTQAGLVNAMGWQISTPDGFEVVWKDGTTAGFASFLGYNRGLGTGVVVLSNASTRQGVNDIGMHLLDSASPFFQLPHRAAAHIQ
ncbi:MAG TPA: serine hydrolase domain-containing protein [Bryobacteraceae bacterium]|nr:serine hydrolase domain-containing protein [Bryobacteraceae bacterium]